MPVAGQQYFVIDATTYGMLQEMLGPGSTALEGFEGFADGYYYAPADTYLSMELYGYIEDIGGSGISLMYYMYSGHWQTGL